MKNLNEFTQEQLESFSTFEEMIFDNESTTRLLWWFGQERTEPSTRQILKEMGLGEFEKQFRKLEKEGQMEMMKDDGTFHCSFSNHLLNGLNLDQFEQL